jgi:hypothetical protein
MESNLLDDYNEVFFVPGAVLLFKEVPDDRVIGELRAMLDRIEKVNTERANYIMPPPD